jgi:Undecaprenyl-phosphate galactose phosphotransferase WbaP
MLILNLTILCPEDFDPLFQREVIEKIKLAGGRYAISPPTSGASLYGLEPHYYFGYRIVLLESKTPLLTFGGRLTKSALDKTLAFCALIVLLPIFLVLILIVRRDGGPAFYGQKRVGQDGREFKCWKFRSMIPNADIALKEHLEKFPEAREEYARDFKLKDDPRITRIGNVLRRSSIDELPQLYNVLKGEMSLVGPRPIVLAETEFYKDKLKYYLAVKPGITGLWQVSGRNDISYAQRIALDAWYVENWSVWNDLVIIMKTIYVVLVRKGAY